MEKDEIARYEQFHIFSSTGRRPANFCHGVVSVVRLIVRSSLHASVRKLLLQKTSQKLLTGFLRISQECSLGGPLSNSLK